MTQPEHEFGPDDETGPPPYSVEQMLSDVGDIHALNPFTGGIFIGYEQKLGARFWFSSLTDEQICYIRVAMDSMIQDMFKAAEASREKEKH